MQIIVEGNEVRVERPSDEAKHRALHGLTRTLIANMVEGVTNGTRRRWISSASAIAPRSRARSWC